MLRFLALTAVLFAIPFLAYSAWIMASHRRLPQQSDFPTGRLVAFSIVGAVLVLIGLIWLALSETGISGNGERVTTILGTLAG